MAEICKFPMCNRIVEKDGYCFLHKIYSGAKDVKEPTKPIAKASKKRKLTNKEYKKIVSEVITKDPTCQVKSPVCTGKAQGLNHKQKRSPKNLIEKDNLEACCNACNLFIEENPDWAKENGHTISRFKK